MTDPQPLPGSDRLACNCHYPIGIFKSPKHTLSGIKAFSLQEFSAPESVCFEDTKSGDFSRFAGLVVFLVFTIASLILCICICCIDITKCSFYKRQKERPLLRRTSTFDPRFMDGPRIQRKFSVDPRLLASLDNGLSRQGSIVGPILPAVTHAECNGNLYGMYFPNEALVTTV